MNKSTRSQIRNLLLALALGVVGALLFSALLLYKYNPTGQYEIKNILLSPDLMNGLNFNDKNSKTGGMSRFVFDKIVFEYPDLKTGKLEKVTITNDQYRAFYQMIYPEKSLLDVPDDVKNLFNKGALAKLKLEIRTESNASFQALEKVFQEVDFASEGNYFRVELRQSDSPNEEKNGYFYNQDIYKKARQLFLNEV